MLDLPVFFPDGSSGAPGPGGNGGILLETSGFVLMEDGSYILIE